MQHGDQTSHVFSVVSMAASFIAALVAGIALWWLYMETAPNPLGSVGDTAFDLKTYESIDTVATTQVDLPEGYNLYTNGRLNFAALYPTFYVPNEVQETAISSSVLFAPVGGGTGVQVYVVYYPKAAIDDEQFKRDVPSGVRENVTKTILGGVEAVQFESSHVGLGKTHEVWAIYDGYLYEITVPYTDKVILDQMVSSWRFLRPPQSRSIEGK